MDSAALDAADEARVLTLLEAASRRVDQRCRRFFYTEHATRYFDGDGYENIYVPDLLAVPDTTDGIKLDEDGDRTYELSLAAATDYYLEHAGRSPGGPGGDLDAAPFNVLRLDAVNGQRSTFTWRRRLIEIGGSPLARWGYTEATEAVVTGAGVAVTGTLADAADLTLAVSDDADLAIGQTLRLGDVDTGEQLYISGGTASPFTVVRGLNGTTAAEHTDVALRRFSYLPEVVEAVVMLASRMWKRRESAYSNIISNEVAGTMQVFRQLDPDVEALLAPLVRYSTMVA